MFKHGPAPAPPEAMAGLLVLPWYQDQIRRAAKRVKASIAQESAPGRSPSVLATIVCHVGSRRDRPIRPRAGWFVARGHGNRACLFPLWGILFGPTRPKPVACVTRHWAGDPITTTIGTARWVYASEAVTASNGEGDILGRLL